jgi:hypothetical protein
MGSPTRAVVGPARSFGQHFPSAQVKHITYTSVERAADRPADLTAEDLLAERRMVWAAAVQQTCDPLHTAWRTGSWSQEVAAERPAIARHLQRQAEMPVTRPVSTHLCAPAILAAGAAQALAAAQRRIRCAPCRTGDRSGTEGPPALPAGVATEAAEAVATTAAEAHMVLRVEGDRAIRRIASATRAVGPATVKQQ